MQDHRNAGGPPPRPSPHSTEYIAQKVVLGQLVVDPPAAGDRLADLPDILGLPRASVNAAIDAVERAGLAERLPETVRATVAALYFRVPLAGDAANAKRQAALEVLLEHHPALLSMNGVIRYLTAGSEDFSERDDVANAVRELVESGLAHRLGPFVCATLAAVRFEAIAG